MLRDHVNDLARRRTDPALMSALEDELKDLESRAREASNKSRDSAIASVR